MATKDDRPTLLSKMAMFVRNPTKDWSELDRPEPEQEPGYDKQALKSMIERKRQNDFVRKREFDNLRKLRRNDPAAIAGAARPSFFQSSLPADAEGRADTLKKIDEIEAQMSKQWWKGKQEAAAQAAGFPVAPAPVEPVAEPVKPEPSTLGVNPMEESFDATTVARLHPQAAGSFVAEFAATEMGDGMPGLPQGRGDAPPRAAGAVQGADPLEVGFSSSELFAIEPDNLMTDPELEEAAIRFANGDDAGAESALVEALKGEALVPEVAKTWVVSLLDFYRATGQSSAFDRAVMDHYDWISPMRPRWIDIGRLKGSDSATMVTHSGGNSSLRAPHDRAAWVCPIELTADAMEALRVTLSQALPPWHLDWSGLNDIAESALPFLAGLFGSLCVEDVELQFSGGDRLTKALQDLTPTGDREAGNLAWTVRLDALRVMRLQDAFELAALDFCITFEVPPPEWQPANCIYSSVGDDLPMAATAVPPSSTMPLGLNGVTGTSLTLSGQIVGETGSALSLLGTDHASGAHLVVSCKALVRVDFSAAGSILNWAATCHSKGCQIQFRDVHRLVGAFFNVIGITEYARVLPTSVE